MTEREAALRKIAVGDMFHASVGLDGPSYPCLTLQVREDAIFARRMTTQSVHWFDRRTGAEIDKGRIVIDSVEPLPDDIREIMLSIDRLFREAEHRRAGGARLGAGRESFPPVEGPDPRPALHRRLLRGPSIAAATIIPAKLHNLRGRVSC